MNMAPTYLLLTNIPYNIHKLTERLAADDSIIMVWHVRIEAR